MPLNPTHLRRLIESRYRNQEEAARDIGISRPRLNEMLNGRRIEHIELGAVERLARALEVTVDELLTK